MAWLLNLMVGMDYRAKPGKRKRPGKLRVFTWLGSGDLLAGIVSV
jgi:hypothetical protein